ncbi:histidine-containing phosphotransfer protein 4-like [Diospyros lotus]|uniref:histidine-containing phosphotransfer protein 4-like n=1 Tax=Diospyros lotus TaxID=55363 RepID=UPI00224DF878|nr:histidine-containing phosphotransfer protein 4-like [Diospyros lotus]
MDRRQLVSMRQSLFDEGFLGEKFDELRELQDDDFVEEIVTVFFAESAQSIQKIEKECVEITPIDFSKLNTYLHKIKGSCSSIGAKKVLNECLQFRVYCNAGYEEGCKIALQHLKKELSTLKEQLDAYFQHEFPQVRTQVEYWAADGLEY